MSVSVVIPVYNPDNRLSIIIDRLLNQTMKPEKILLIHTIDFTIDNMLMYELSEKYKGDGTVEIIEILKKEFDHGGTRHMAMERCNSEYVLYMTEDAVPKNKKLISNLVLTMESDDNIAAVYGKQEAYRNCNVIESYTRVFNYPDESFVNSKRDLPVKGIKTYFLSDVCTMYRRSMYEEIGGFPGKTILNEDSIYGAKAIQMDKLLAYNSEAVVYHSHNYTASEQFKRNFDIGVSHRQFKYIFENVPAEGEGLKLVKETTDYLVRRRKWYLVPYLFFYSGCKYAGYRLGKLYNKLPKEIIKMCTMNKSYWDTMR